MFLKNLSMAWMVCKSPLPGPSISVTLCLHIPPLSNPMRANSLESGSSSHTWEKVQLGQSFLLLLLRGKRGTAAA